MLTVACTCDTETGQNLTRVNDLGQSWLDDISKRDMPEIIGAFDMTRGST